ncbi:ATP synthase regulation protein NCA2-domain-containing protein [Lipomyces japonicus]|uniref:ATP synthase regulation protein NCA2-domain-containing protein n=1 Tax=Lipomyces japonicus TaxID=56871 RepID=UPI0034CEE399
MSTIVNVKIETLSAQLEFLAASTLPALIGPKEGVSTPSNDESGSESEHTAASGTLSDSFLGFLNSLLVHKGEPLPSLSRLNSVLTNYLAQSCDAQYAQSVKNVQKSGDLFLEDEQSLKSYDDSLSNEPYKQIEWFIVTAGLIAVYGHVLDTLLNETLPISEDLFYWDSVLSSTGGLLTYSVQTSPIQLFKFSYDVFLDTRHRLSRQSPSLGGWIKNIRKAIHAHRKHVIKLTFIRPAQSSILKLFTSPLINAYKEIQSNQHKLERLRELQSASLGVLVGESPFVSIESDSLQVIDEGVTIIEKILEGLHNDEINTSIETFEHEVLHAAKLLQKSSSLNNMAERLLRIINVLLPKHVELQTSIAMSAGRPSQIIRYWPAVFSFTVFGGTALRFLFNRRASIAQWATDSVQTVIDFWNNWVVVPAKSVFATIRHDNTMQVAIVAKKSLESDMESLERMVVDFAIDYSSTELSTQEVGIIREGVRDGDMSAVSRVYEEELKSPVANLIRGGLVRSLLIQIQKAKIDAEVAITGIDKLLKSQELVFAIVAALPSVLACYGSLVGVKRLYSGRGITYRGKRGRDIVRTLGTIDRLLTVNQIDNNSTSTLSYVAQGRLLCEIHVLRHSTECIPLDMRKEWQRDLGDLENLKGGILRQAKTVERIWKVYGNFFNI